MPLLRFSGVDQAFADVTGIQLNGIFADIGDFFP